MHTGYAFNRTAHYETVRQIKEKLCCVGYNIDQNNTYNTYKHLLIYIHTLKYIHTLTYIHINTRCAFNRTADYKTVRLIKEMLFM